MNQCKQNWSIDILNQLENINVGYKEIITFKDINESMYDVLKENAYTLPQSIGVIDDFGNQYSYLRLLSLTDQFADYLYYERHITLGSHVGAILYNSIEFIVTFLACQKIGATFIPFPIKYSDIELSALIERSNSNLIIAENKFKHFEKQENKVEFIFCDTNQEVYTLDIYKTKKKLLSNNENLNSNALIIFTSGTTSGSKGVLIKNYQVQHSVSAYKNIFKVGLDDSTILAIPIYNVTGLIAIFSLFLKAKGRMYIHKFFKPERILNDIQIQRISFLHGSPTIFHLLLRERRSNQDLNSLRILACGSGNLPSKVIKEIKDWIPNMEFRTVYGLTETASPATIFPSDASISEFIGSSGVTIPGVKVKVVNDELKELDCFEKGEILLKGSNIISEYYNMNSSSITNDGWLKTGDIGYINYKGYIYITDRKKDIINRGGEKIYSIDIENALSEIKEIKEVAVVGKSSDIYGEIPIAVVTLNKNCNIDLQNVREELKKILAKYEIPEEIIVRNEILKTSNGKVDKKTIRKLVEKGEYNNEK